MRKARNATSEEVNLVTSLFAKWCKEVDRTKRINIDWTKFISDKNCKTIAARFTEMDIPTDHEVNYQTIKRYLKTGYISDVDIAIDIVERTKSIDDLRHILLSRKYKSRWIKAKPPEEPEA